MKLGFSGSNEKIFLHSGPEEVNSDWKIRQKRKDSTREEKDACCWLGSSFPSKIARIFSDEQSSLMMSLIWSESYLLLDKIRGKCVAFDDAASDSGVLACISNDGKDISIMETSSLASCCETMCWVIAGGSCIVLVIIYLIWVKIWRKSWISNIKSPAYYGSENWRVLTSWASVPPVKVIDLRSLGFWICRCSSRRISQWTRHTNPLFRIEVILGHWWNLSMLFVLFSCILKDRCRTP